MRPVSSLAGMIALSSLLAVPVLAQQQQQPSAVVATSTATMPNLAVAAVKLRSGLRASKLIGSSVYNEQGQQIGSLDDLIVSSDNSLVDAIISVCGFLGIGSKLVAVPYNRVQIDPNMVTAQPACEWR
jgi:sporulation protein YlmC with PRC-barrel domain